MLAQTMSLQRAARALERAEVIQPGERVTRAATAALAMYRSERWFAISADSGFRGAVLKCGSGTSGWYIANEASGVIGDA